MALHRYVRSKEKHRRPIEIHPTQYGCVICTGLRLLVGVQRARAQRVPAFFMCTGAVRRGPSVQGHSLIDLIAAGL